MVGERKTVVSTYYDFAYQGVDNIYPCKYDFLKISRMFSPFPGCLHLDSSGLIGGGSGGAAGTLVTGGWGLALASRGVVLEGGGIMVAPCP